jgi:8-oxo-dGTP pyrophosphatase MutT (NUDIX family)
MNMKKLEEFTPQLYLSDYGILHANFDRYSIDYEDKEWKPDEKTERRIERIWKKMERKAKRERRGLWSIPGSMARVKNMVLMGGNLLLFAQPTGYRSHVGTMDLKERYEPEHPLYALRRANPLYGNLLLPIEGYLLFGKRSSKVAFDSGKISAVSGNVDPREDVEDGKIKVENTVGREFSEETGLVAKLELKPYAVQCDPLTHQYHLDFWFLGRSNLTKHEIERDFKKSELTEPFFVEISNLESEFDKLRSRFSVRERLMVKYLIDTGNIRYLT